MGFLSVWEMEGGGGAVVETEETIFLLTGRTGRTLAPFTILTADLGTDLTAFPTGKLVPAEFFSPLRDGAFPATGSTGFLVADLAATLDFRAGMAALTTVDGEVFIFTTGLTAELTAF